MSVRLLVSITAQSSVFLLFSGQAAAWHGSCTAHTRLYSVTALGISGHAYALNSAGEVTGISSSDHAFLYRDGTVEDLGTFGGEGSVGLSINSAGRVTGYSLTGVYNPVGEYDVVHAFLYKDGELEDIGTLGGDSSAGMGINAAGQIVGGSSLSSGEFHAFIYRKGKMTDIGTLGGTHASATSINSAGQVAGWSFLQGNRHSHAFLYAKGRMHDLGTLGGTDSVANAINSKGEVTGDSAIAGNTATHAFLYRKGEMQDLGALGGLSSSGLAINAAGQVVGLVRLPRTGPWPPDYVIRAFLYCDGMMVDLNTLIDPESPFADVTLSDATGITDGGVILANGVDPEGRGSIFLLAPE